jgi:predicted RNase H-like HicB family nuclease
VGKRLLSPPGIGSANFDQNGILKSIQELERTMNKPFYVHAEWDAEASVWVAASDDVPGLATEADTTEALVQKLKTLIPELLEANGLSASGPVAFELLTRRFELAA